MNREPAADRFWRKVDKTAPLPEHRPDLGPCWLWTAARSTAGYGRFAVSAGNQHQAHRFAYELLVGPIPEGLQLDHLCRVRACVRPGHLEPVTCRENLLRGLTVTARHASVTECPKGHPYNEENTFHYDDQRVCRECRRQSSNRYNARMRQLKAVS